MGERNRRKIRVAVVFGGQSAEHDVSLRSARTVIGALDQDRYDVTQIGITREGRWLAGGEPMAALTAISPMFLEAWASNGNGSHEHLPAIDPNAPMTFPPDVGDAVDVVFPVLHGPFGEDGTVQGMLELTGLPYVGSGVLGSAVAMDKVMTKTVLSQIGIPQLPWVQLPRKEWERDPDAWEHLIVDRLGFPCFTKPANLGSSVGISKVHGPAELRDAIAAAARHDRRIVVEKGVDGREIELSVMGNDDPIASVAGEVVPATEFYDYNAKYIDDTAKLIIPAEIGADLLGQLQETAIDAFKALDLAGLARVDFFVERGTDRIYLNEINTLPGFTSISMYPMLWQASGVPLPELVDRLIGFALERHAEKRRQALD